MKRTVLFAVNGLVYLLSVFLCTPIVAFAQEFTPYEEIWRKSQSLNPAPSFDTTPVTVRVVSVVYRIPRNYLTFLGQIPALKLTWPGLKPLTEETRKCFGSILQSEQAGCTSFEFHVLGSRGPAPGGRAFTNAEKFANFMKAVGSPQRKHGPFDYDLYEIGPEEARIEVYRRAEGDIYFRCSFSGGDGRKRGGVCDDTFRLHDMNHVRFFFRLMHIEHIPEIEAGIRRLMAGFVVQGGSNDINGVESNDSKRN